MRNILPYEQKNHMKIIVFKSWLMASILVKPLESIEDKILMTVDFQCYWRAAMHDILEGVLQYEMKEMLKDFIKAESLFTLQDLNCRLAKFDFGYYNDANKPSPITEQKLSSNNNNLKQHGKCVFSTNLYVCTLNH